eukprot:1235394-Rhodomonas_salina.3
MQRTAPTAVELSALFQHPFAPVSISCDGAGRLKDAAAVQGRKGKMGGKKAASRQAASLLILMNSTTTGTGTGTGTTPKTLIVILYNPARDRYLGTNFTDFKFTAQFRRAVRNSRPRNSYPS